MQASYVCALASNAGLSQFCATNLLAPGKSRLEWCGRAGAGRVKLVVNPGGRMLYSRDAWRQGFRAEAEARMK